MTTNEVFVLYKSGSRMMNIVESLWLINNRKRNPYRQIEEERKTMFRLGFFVIGFVSIVVLGCCAINAMIASGTINPSVSSFCACFLLLCLALPLFWFLIPYSEYNRNEFVRDVSELLQELDILPWNLLHWTGQDFASAAASRLYQTADSIKRAELEDNDLQSYRAKKWRKRFHKQHRIFRKFSLVEEKWDKYYTETDPRKQSNVKAVEQVFGPTKHDDGKSEEDVVKK